MEMLVPDKVFCFSEPLGAETYFASKTIHYKRPSRRLCDFLKQKYMLFASRACSPDSEENAREFRLDAENISDDCGYRK